MYFFGNLLCCDTCTQNLPDFFRTRNIFTAACFLWEMLGIASVVFHTRQDCCSFPGCMHHPPQYCTQWWLLQIRQILTDSNLIIQSRRRTMRFEIESSFHFLLWDLHNAPLAAMQWFQCRQDRWRLMQDPFHDAKKYFHSNFKRELNWANLSDRENWEAMIQIILLIYNWLLYADIKLWMPSSATLYCYKGVFSGYVFQQLYW